MNMRLAAGLVLLVSLSLAPAQEVPNAPAVPQGDWAEVWPGYVVLPWSFHTPPLNDATAKAYRDQGINGIHVDRLISKSEGGWIDAHGFRFYLDHTASKGYLYLHRSLQSAIRRDTPDCRLLNDDGLVIRPYCLRDRMTTRAMETFVRLNVGAAAPHNPICYSLDDEISTATFLSPVSTCGAEPCRAAFRTFALDLYGGSLDRLNAAWKTDHSDTRQVVGATPVAALHQAATQSAETWNFAHWADFRQYMDQTLMDTLVSLVRLANEVDPKRPAGFEGAQQPAAWGGYDYSRIGRAVQWIENYDIGNNDEILRTMAPNVPRMKTYGGSTDPVFGRWRLWYYFCHGVRGTIIWPDLGDKLWWNEKAELRKDLAYLPATFKELQSDRLTSLLVGARPIDDGVAIYYSQPSIRAAWVLDATVHGPTWPRRSGNVDTRTGSPVNVRAAWLAMLQDAQIQYRFIDAPALAEGQLTFPQSKVLILPYVLAMSDTEIKAVREFVRAGGTVIADYLPALMDEHCGSRGRASGLDDLFGVRHDFGKGFFDGTHLTYDNGEQYRQRLRDRLFREGTVYESGWPVVERGLQRAGASAPLASAEEAARFVAVKVGKGRALLLNCSPISYLLNRSLDDANPQRVLKYITDAAGQPSVTVRTAGTLNNVVRWRKGEREIVCVVKGRGEWSTVDLFGTAREEDAGGEVALGMRPADLTLSLTAPDLVGPVINARTGKPVNLTSDKAGVHHTLSDMWTPCEAAIYVFNRKR